MSIDDTKTIDEQVNDEVDQAIERLVDRGAIGRA